VRILDQLSQDCYLLFRGDHASMEQGHLASWAADDRSATRRERALSMTHPSSHP
jgi:hypothetical protein